MKILVTGTAGFIGSHLVERLVADGHEITGLDSFDSFLYDAETKERNAREVATRTGFQVRRGDLLDGPLVAALCQGQDVVVHLAALAGVRPSIADPPRYARANLEGTVNVLEGCRAAGVKRLVFASSSSVYGARSLTDPAPFREDDPCLEPASPYAATKRAGELLCSTYRDLFGIGVSSLRFFTVYGPRQRPDMAIHKFTRALAAGQPITLFGDGRTARDYTYIDDVIDGICGAIRRVKPGDRDIYNLGGSHTTELRELVDIISGTLGVTPKVDWQPPQPGDVPITFADVSKSGRDLGYAPRVPLRDGIARFVEWYRARG